MIVHPFCNMHNTGIVILAAGSSSRLGSPKQLLPFQNKNLLQHVIDEATATGAVPVVVVTGARSEVISAAIDTSNADVVWNEQWPEGKASGIVAGVRRIVSSYPQVEYIILAVCDQPFVSAGLFTQLFEKQLFSKKNIVASAYADTLGTPVLLGRKYFDALLALKEDEGARKILMMHRDDVAGVDFPLGHIDIDTQADYDSLTVIS